MRLVVGWGIGVRAEPGDMLTWKLLFNPGFDPWIEEHDGEVILRSKELNAQATIDDAITYGRALLDQLNGALALFDGSGKATYGCVAQFTEDGKVHRTVRLEGAHFRMGARLHVNSTRFDAHGNAIEPTTVQAWMRTFDDDMIMLDCLTYYGRSDNWFDFYKAIECLCQRFGGEHKFERMTWVDASEFNLVKRTANYHRHARSKGELPPNYPSFEQAKTSLAKWMRGAIGEIG